MNKRPNIFIGVLTISLFFFSIVNAQESLLFSQISTKDGLSQNTVRSIVVDNMGFLWMGTLDGLVRYDGTRFITYKPEPGKPNNLTDQRVRSIHEDQDGFLWIKTYDNSFSCYNSKLECFVEFEYMGNSIPLLFTNYLETQKGDIWLWGDSGCVKIKKDIKGTPKVVFHSSSNAGKLTRDYVNFVFKDSFNSVWIGCELGLNRMDSSGKIDQFYNQENLGAFRKAIELNSIIYFLSDDIIYRYDLKKQIFLSPFKTSEAYSFLDIVQLNKDSFLVSSVENGLFKVDIASGIFLKNPFANSVPFNNAPQIILDAREGVWVYNDTGRMIFYNPATNKIKEMQLISPEVASVIDDGRYNILIDSKGVYWITTYGNGLYRYDVESDSLTNYLYNKVENSPASDYLLSIDEDHFGNLWIGSEYAGVIKVSKKKHNVKYVNPEESETIGTSNSVKVIFEDTSDNIWLGTKNGSLYVYDNQLNNKKRIEKNINPYTIIEDNKGRIWVGTKGNGIYIYDKKTHKQCHHFVHEEDIPNSLCHNSIFDIIQDSEKRIWIASFGGGIDLVTEFGDSFHFSHYLNDKGNISYVRCLLQDKKGLIWAGSYKGLISFDPEEFINKPNAYTIYTYNSGHPAGLNCGDVKVIFEDSRGEFWIGTAGGGLNLFDANSADKQGAFIKYTKKEGLPSDIITSIMESKDSVLWVSTESGLTHIEKGKNTFLTYQFSNSTNGNFYNENACWLKDNGEMLWGTLDGLLVLDPSSIIINQSVPMVQLTDFFIFDQRIEVSQPNSPLTESISSTDEIVLKHDQNTFTLNFACLDVTDPSRNKYSYHLEPYDQYWSSPNSNNWATYKNMPYGEYTFEVKGGNADGEWNNKIRTFQITVLPPIWKTNFAIVLYFLIIVGIAFVIIRFLLRISTLNNAVKMEKQLTDYKLRFFTNISHEFRTPLTLIKGAVERMNDIKELPAEVSKNVKLLHRNTLQMSRLIDQLLEFRKLQNNVLSLNMEITDISDFARNAYYAFKEIAFQKNIEYQFEGIDGKWDFYIDRNKVEKILFNLLSNAFKFTPAKGKIICRVAKDDLSGNCLISVLDTGVGIPKDKRELLFGRFMKLNTSAEGTGIGLELVKEFTEAHKGKVEYSPNPEGGSIFRVELPTNKEVYTDAKYLDAEESDNKEANQQEYNNDHAIQRPVNPHHWKILVIDDNYDIREYLQDELQHHFDIELAVDGKDGLDKAIASNPTLIICDVKMPEMDGLEVTRRLKDNFETSHIPIILLTAMSSDTMKLQGSENGADEYIMKPFSLKYLLSRVYFLIEQREKLKKRFSVDIDVKKGVLSQGNKDQVFYDLLNKIIDEHLTEASFTVTEFTELAGQTRTLFYKKVKGLTGYSPNELIKIKRMKKAAELIVEDKYNVSEVSWQVGIEDPFYFSKCFKAQFGCSPSKYGK
ncbi:MAG: hybrid sensor histidine kinase/response regulator [Bacteroidales bacterium]|nr:MAG: hybrid sensor histidine kinase/response regulator [Bacteroidales bacterium]